MVVVRDGRGSITIHEPTYNPDQAAYLALSSETEQARITLTHLAEKLGYSDKRDLKRLAERHSHEIAEFGMVGTVPVTVAGRFGQTIQEPTYNRKQTITPRPDRSNSHPSPTAPNSRK